MPLPWATAAAITQPLAAHLDVQGPPVLRQEGAVDVQQQLRLQADVDLEGWGTKFENKLCHGHNIRELVMIRPSN